MFILGGNLYYWSTDTIVKWFLIDNILIGLSNELGMTNLMNVAVKREVVESGQNSLTENETETFANDDIFKYIDDEENKQNDCKLLNWK